MHRKRLKISNADTKKKRKNWKKKRKIKTSSYKKITKLERVDVYTSTLLLVLSLNMTKIFVEIVENRKNTLYNQHKYVVF